MGQVPTVPGMPEGGRIQFTVRDSNDAVESERCGSRQGQMEKENADLYGLP